MKTGALISILLTTVATAAAGCSVEADVPDVEVTQRGVVFQGVNGAGGDTSMARSFSQQHGTRSSTARSNSRTVSTPRSGR
jgi:hypothetical protein